MFRKAHGVRITPWKGGIRDDQTPGNSHRPHRAAGRDATACAGQGFVATRWRQVGQEVHLPAILLVGGGDAGRASPETCRHRQALQRGHAGVLGRECKTIKSAGNGPQRCAQGAGRQEPVGGREAGRVSQDSKGQHRASQEPRRVARHNDKQAERGVPHGAEGRNRSPQTADGPFAGRA